MRAIIALMISTYRYKTLVWTDLKSPTEEELAFVAEELPPVDIKEFFLLHSKPTIFKQYGISAHTLPLPLWDRETGKVMHAPFRFVRFDNQIATMHDAALAFLDNARYLLESENKSLSNPASENADYVYKLILEEIAKHSHKELKEYEEYKALRATEQKIHGKKDPVNPWLAACVGLIIIFAIIIIF